MADPSHIINISTPAVIEWVDTDGRMRYQCLQEGCPPPSLSTYSASWNPITLEASFDASTKAGFFKLRAPFKMLNSKQEGFIFLFIHPEQVTVLVTEQPNTVPVDITEQLGTSPIRLQFYMNKPADVVVPRGDLLPGNEFASDNLYVLDSLAQNTTITFYVAQIWEEQLRLVSDAISRGGVRSYQGHADLTSLYFGRGGRIYTGTNGSLPSKVLPPDSSDSEVQQQGFTSKAGKQPLPPYPGLLPIPPDSSSAGDVSKKRRRSSSGAGVEEYTSLLRHLVAEMYGGLGQEVCAIREELHATKQELETTKDLLERTRQEQEEQATKHEALKLEQAVKHEALKQELETTKGLLERTKKKRPTMDGAVKQELDAMKQKLHTASLGSHRSTLESGEVREQLESTQQRLEEIPQVLRAILLEQAPQVLSEVLEEVLELKKDTVQHVDRSIEEVKREVEVVKEQLEEQIAEIMNQTSQELDFQFDEQLTTAKWELQDFVKDEVREVGRGIVRHLRDTAFYLNVDSP